ncbi:MAG: TIGR03668 family PPOX class F420-dependent oxidoreductase [Candidatus Limnocylindria bacterium]
MKLGARSQKLLAEGRIAHLATADQYARPHLVPIVFAWQDVYVFTPIDQKPKSVSDWRELRRVRNIEANGRVSVEIDEYSEDWTRLVWVRVDGVAEILTSGAAHDLGIQLLEAKYPQYERMPLGDAPIVRITIERVSEWHG